MSGKFPDFFLKSKLSSNMEGGRKAKLISNSSASATSTMSPSRNTSKSRRNSHSPGISKSQTKTKIKAASTSTTFAKKSTSSLSGSRTISVLSSTSDDLSKALVLKKKSGTTSSTSTIQKNNAKIIKQIAGAITDTNENKDCNDLQKTSGYKGTATEMRGTMHNEGPLEIPEDHFDFYSILARPKIWDLDGDEDDGKSAASSIAEEFKIKKLSNTAAQKDEHSTHAHHVLSSQPCGSIKAKVSEIWGDMRSSSAEESSVPPSLTSISGDEKKGSVEDTGKVSEETMERDENNNVLESIKNGIYRSFTFFELSRSSTTTTTNTTVTSVEDKSGEKNGEETKVDYDEGNEPAIVSSSKEPDQVNGSEGKINAQPGHNSNIHNSPTPSGISLHGSSQDSVLIPLDIKAQLQKAFHANSGGSSPSVESQLDSRTKQLADLPCVDTKLENCEVVNLRESMSAEDDEPPPLTKIQQSEEEIKDSSSLQLILNGLEQNAVEETGNGHFCNPESSSIRHISPISSYTSAAADEEFFYADTVQNIEEFDSQQTQTQSTASHDAETDTEGTLESENKKEKLMRMAMAVNTGVDISPSQEQEKRTLRLRGIIKACRAESIHIDGAVTSEEPLSKRSDAKARRRAIGEKIKYPQTFSQVGADYGFPADISISRIIGSIVKMTWASPNIEGVTSSEMLADENKEANNDTTCSSGDGISHLMETAYRVFDAGLKYASDFIGVEAELEPREDWIRYNGYKIRVYGRKLLLESLHVNCDFNIDSNGICCRSNHSSVALKSSSLSRTELEQSCEGRRIRIVVRVAGPLAQEDAEQTSSATALEHNVCHSDGKWTFIFGNGEKRDNFIEIGCPTGVHPESLAFGVLNGLLLVEAP